MNAKWLVGSHKSAMRDWRNFSGKNLRKGWVLEQAILEREKFGAGKGMMRVGFTVAQSFYQRLLHIRGATFQAANDSVDP